MNNSKISDMLFEAAEAVKDIFYIKSPRLEQIDLTVPQFIFSWTKANKERVFYSVLYENNKLSSIRRLYAREDI